MLERKYQLPGTRVYLIDDEAEALEDANVLFPLRKGEEYMIIRRIEEFGTVLLELDGFPGDLFAADLFSQCPSSYKSPKGASISDLFEQKVKQLQNGK